MPHQQLAILLDQETAGLQQLLHILSQEHDSLLSANVDSVERATAAKNQALDTQVKAMLSRQEFTARCAIDSTDNSLMQFIASCKNKDELSASFARITDLVRQCSDINRTNGRLIKQKQQQTRSALNILRQTDAHSPTYSGRGTTADTQTNRSLGKA